MASGRVILDTTSPIFLQKASIRSSTINIPSSSWNNKWVSYPEFYPTVPILARFSGV